MKQILNDLQIRLHLRSELHLSRKLWHMLTGMLMVTFYASGISRSAAVAILTVALGLCLAIETIRLRIPVLNEWAIRFWGPLMRTSEFNRMSGTPAYLGAAIISIALFPQTIAMLSLLYLAFGDPLAALFGVLYGDKSIRFSNGKSLIGTLAGVAACFLVTLVFLSGTAISFPVIIIVAAIGGLVGGAAELLPLEVDDNFAIPVVSGFVLWLVFILFQI